MQWYALYTRSRQEERAAHYLASRDYNVFVPHVEVVRTRRSKRIRVLRPMFPGYIFVETDLLQRDSRLEIVRSPYVVRILGYGEEPAPVPREQVESLQIIVNSGLPVNPYPYLQIGQRVRVTTGAMRDVVGILVEKRNARTLVISVDMMSRSVEVLAEVGMVEPY
jgi:transcription elongation factor/antiterminator RfaH